MGKCENIIKILRFTEILQDYPQGNGTFWRHRRFKSGLDAHLFIPRRLWMASSSAKKKLQYDKQSKKAFVDYFVKPKPKKRKRGRPKKRKRGRPHKVVDLTQPAQTMLDSTDNSTLDHLTPKDKDDLDARLEGTLRKAARTTQKRINWDVGLHAVFRKQCADSWFKRNDLYKEGESFNLFCKRCGIHRSVLRRYIKGKYVQNCLTQQRGRPSLLSMSVMKHLCEGQYYYYLWCLCRYDI